MTAAHTSSPPNPGLKSVLIVDDHADIRYLLSITLGKEYRLLSAEDGATALALIREKHPDVVLLDVMMPGELDGLAVLDAVKSDSNLRGTLVAMLTARGQLSDHEKARRLGADAYFVKPFSPLEVVQWVRKQFP